MGAQVVVVFYPLHVDDLFNCPTHFPQDGIRVVLFDRPVVLCRVSRHTWGYVGRPTHCLREETMRRNRGRGCKKHPGAQFAKSQCGLMTLATLRGTNHDFATATSMDDIRIVARSGA